MPNYLRRLHNDQRGFTAVEVIVAVAVGGLVMAAIFPVFLLLNRVETTWRENEQARAVGLVAEQSLSRDLREYDVIQPGNYDVDKPDCAGCQQLVLQAGPKSGPGETTFCVNYFLEKDPGSGDLPRLVRTVGPKSDPSQRARSIVAHGVRSFATTETGGQIEVEMTLTGSGGRRVTLDPPLRVTPLVAPVASRDCR